jgi:hypothetical protein
LPGVEHRQHWYLNNRAENSQPTHPPARTAHATVQVSWTLAMVSGRRMVPLPNISDRAVIVCLRPYTVKKCANGSRCGGK